jgi:hypothetical protein
LNIVQRYPGADGDQKVIAFHEGRDLRKNFGDRLGFDRQDYDGTRGNEDRVVLGGEDPVLISKEFSPINAGFKKKHLFWR